MSKRPLIKIEFQNSWPDVGFIGPDLGWAIDGPFFRVSQGDHSYFFPESQIKMAQIWYEDESTARLPAPSPSAPLTQEVEARVHPFRLN